MPIGDVYGAFSAKLGARIFFNLLGTPDIHTHLRLRPMINYIKKYVANFNESRIYIIEAGCGAGINAFEISKICQAWGEGLSYTGIDKNEEAIAKAIDISKRGLFSGEFSFYSDDAIGFLQKCKGSNADVVLLIDILEHVEKVKDLLRAAIGCLKPSGLFIVSVPTQLYPKVFGKPFHRKIGHVVEGYSVEGLDELFVNGMDCRRITYQYNTGFLSNIGCYLYYNLFGLDNRYVDYLKSALLYPFRFLDIYNSARVSCTLFAVYRK